MTYNELEQRLGKILKESGSTTSAWDRFPQALRQDGIREAERRLALDLPVAAIPNLVKEVELDIDANFQYDLNDLSLPLLKKLFYRLNETANNRLILEHPREMLPKIKLMESRFSKPFCYPIKDNIVQFEYQSGLAITDDPLLTYIKEPQTMRQFKPGYLLGGTSPLTTVATWAAEASCEFAVTIDGTAGDITGIDFSSVLSMSGVASTIQTTLATTFSGALVRWDAINTRFIVISGGTSGITSVSVMTDPGNAAQDISGVAAGWMDCDAGATGVEAVEGTAEFEFGNWETELVGHEGALLWYAAYYVKNINNDFDEASDFLKKYEVEIGKTRANYAGQDIASY